jgi:hypothetical protein
MYITINKKWFEENKQKFSDEADEKDNYQILIEDTNAQIEISEDCKFYLYENGFDDNVYVSLDCELEPQHVVEFVEQSIDDIKGDSFAKIIELMVKKLNKFKSLIESIRGL